MGNVYGPGTPRLDGDEVVVDVTAGGKPSKGTPKDGRLKPNKTTTPAPKMTPKKAK